MKQLCFQEEGQKARGERRSKTRGTTNHHKKKKKKKKNKKKAVGSLRPGKRRKEKRGQKRTGGWNEAKINM